MPIRAKLTLLTVATLSVILASVGGFLLVRLRADLIHGVDQNLDTRAAQISLGLGDGCGGEFQDVSDSSLVGLPQGESGAQFLSVRGVVLESSGDQIAERALIEESALADAVSGSHVRQTLVLGSDRESFRILAVALPSGSCRGVIVVGTSLDEVGRSVHRLAVLMLIGGPVAMLLAAAGGWLLATRALRPVARMTLEASEIDANRLDERVQVPAQTDELRRLAETLNTMLDRVQTGVEQKRRFVADASHELRTPLAVMSAELDVTLRDPSLDQRARATLQSAREEITRMSSVVENLLELARVDEGRLTLDIGEVDLADVAARVAAETHSLSRDKSLEVVLACERAPIRGDVERLVRAVANLLGNAVKYSPAGASIEITTQAVRGESILRVSDHGPGIPASMQTTIFDRFVRVDDSRSGQTGGSGLGLAIAREIVEAHGGRIWVESTEGAGSSFSLALPTA